MYMTWTNCPHLKGTIQSIFTYVSTHETIPTIKMEVHTSIAPQFPGALVTPSLSPCPYHPRTPNN